MHGFGFVVLVESFAAELPANAAALVPAHRHDEWQSGVVIGVDPDRARQDSLRDADRGFDVRTPHPGSEAER